MAEKLVPGSHKNHISDKQYEMLQSLLLLYTQVENYQSLLKLRC